MEFVNVKIPYITKHVYSAVNHETTQNSKKIQLFQDQVKRISVLFVSAVTKSYCSPVVFAIIVSSEHKSMKNL